MQGIFETSFILQHIAYFTYFYLICIDFDIIYIAHPYVLLII